jgi:ADP-ribosylglycohydrolase/O-acetyl-ADP-ribose deacetylase (regulator of RNase III)
MINHTRDRAIGSLIGLAIGDAMGAPYEFQPFGYKVVDHYITGGVHNISIGEWTDDTSMALCLAQSLIDCKGFNAKDQMERYLSWSHDGYFCTRTHCFDIGNTVSSALQKYKETKNPYSGLGGDSNSGNGSLMRIAPIALMYRNNKDDLITYAAKSSQMTHKSQLAVDACIVYAQLIAGAINGISKEELLSKEFINRENIREEVLRIIDGSYKEKKEFKATGYVLHTLESALMAFYRYDSFEDGLLHVISLGDDTDTVGAVYGQLAAAYYGYDAIDEKYKAELQQHDKIYNIADRLYTLSNEKEDEEEVSNVTFHIMIGDITTINTDTIVNAANYRLLGGGGVDGAIHRAGGNEILKECRYLRETRYPDGLPVGEAVITTAGKMKAKYVIHTVGPKYNSNPQPQKHLTSCYKNSLLLADKYKCKSIAFPAIATGIYGYPKGEAAQIAYSTLKEMANECKYIKDIVFVFFSEADAVYLKRLLKEA